MSSNGWTRSAPRRGRIWTLLPGLALALAAWGCDDEITAPEIEFVSGQLTVDASGPDSAFVALADDATLASGATPWDIGFWQTAVFAREAGVVALCLCQNTGATDEQIVAMTPESEQADFDAVTAAQIPPASDPRWSSTTFDTNRWYKYNIAPDTQPHRIHPTFDVYLVKKGTSVYKLQILNYYNAADESRHVTFRYQRLTE